MAEIRVRQTLDNSQFKKGLKQSQGMAGQMKSSLAAIGPAVAAAFSVGAIVAFSKESMAAYAEQIKSEAKLVTALKGRQDVADNLIRQANELQKVSLFEDEDIINTQALLATFTQSETQLKSLTPLVLDYAQAFGVDLKVAAIQVGKTLTNVSGVLGKTGFEAEGAAGSAERYASVMQLLTDKFKGQAANAIPEQLKAQRELAVSIEELKEAWGGMITETGAKSGLIEGAAVALNALRDVVSGIKVDNLRDVFTLLTDIMIPLKGIKHLWDGMRESMQKTAAAAAMDKGMADAIEADRQEIEALAKSLTEKGIPADKAAARAKELVYASLIKARGAAEITDQQFALLTAQINALEESTNNSSDAFNINTATLGELEEKVKSLKEIREGQGAAEARLTSNEIDLIEDKILQITDYAAWLDKIKKKQDAIKSNLDSIPDSKDSFSTFEEQQAATRENLAGLGSAMQSNDEYDVNLGSGGMQSEDEYSQQLADNLSGLEEYVNRTGEFLSTSEDQYAAYAKNVQTAMDAIGASIGTALGEFIKGEAKFGDVAKQLLQTIIKIVAGYLTESVAASFAGGASAGGPAAAFTGAAAAAAAIGMFGAIVPAMMARGGTVPGGFPGDSYPAMLSSGETVLPAPIALGSMGGGVQVTGEFRLRGSTLYAAIEKETSKQNRIR